MGPPFLRQPLCLFEGLSLLRTSNVRNKQTAGLAGGAACLFVCSSAWLHIISSIIYWYGSPDSIVIIRSSLQTRRSGTCFAFDEVNCFPKSTVMTHFQVICRFYSFSAKTIRKAVDNSLNPWYSSKAPFGVKAPSDLENWTVRTRRDLRF